MAKSWDKHYKIVYHTIFSNPDFFPIQCCRCRMGFLSMQNNFREAKNRRIKFVPPMGPTHVVTSFYRIYEAVIFHFHAGLDCYECCWLVLDANHSLHIFFCVRLALALLGYGEELVFFFNFFLLCF